jgi:hypothetical protein
MLADWVGAGETAQNRRSPLDPNERCESSKDRKEEQSLRRRRDSLKADVGAKAYAAKRTIQLFVGTKTVQRVVFRVTMSCIPVREGWTEA